MEFASKKKEVLGTVVEIKIPRADSKIFSLLFDEFKRIETKYTRFRDDSYLAELNRKLGRWQKTDEETLFLIKKSLEIRKNTDNSFDITLLDTLEKLGYDKEYSFKEKKSLFYFNLDFSKEKIKVRGNEIFLKKRIELGGIGKGYAIDKAAQIIEKNGILDYYINAGGDIFARHKNKKKEWTILLEHPDFTDRAIGKIGINNLSITSSSSNRRKWGQNHHLIDAKTKKPRNDVKSIFIIAKKTIEADAYATALFTSGFNKAIELAKKLNLSVLIISNENKVYKSEGFEVEYFN